MGAYVLLATVGEAPVVVLETVLGLYHGLAPDHAWPAGRWPNKIYLIYNDTASDQANRNQLMHELNAAIDALDPDSCVMVDVCWMVQCQLSGAMPSVLPEVSFRVQGIDTTRLNWTVWRPTDQLSELSDVRTVKDDQWSANYIAMVMEFLTRNSDGRLHASIAGGRKSMSAHLKSAFSLFRRSHDSISHVLAHKEMELGATTTENFLHLQLASNGYKHFAPSEENIPSSTLPIDMPLLSDFPVWLMIDQRLVRRLMLDSPAAMPSKTTDQSTKLKESKVKGPQRSDGASSPVAEVNIEATTAESDVSIGWVSSKSFTPPTYARLLRLLNELGRLKRSAADQTLNVHLKFDFERKVFSLNDLEIHVGTAVKGAAIAEMLWFWSQPDQQAKLYPVARISVPESEAKLAPVLPTHQRFVALLCKYVLLETDASEVTSSSGAGRNKSKIWLWRLFAGNPLALRFVLKEQPNVNAWTARQVFLLADLVLWFSIYQNCKGQDFKAFLREILHSLANPAECEPELTALCEHQQSNHDDRNGVHRRGTSQQKYADLIKQVHAERSMFDKQRNTTMIASDIHKALPIDDLELFADPPGKQPGKGARGAGKFLQGAGSGSVKYWIAHGLPLDHSSPEVVLAQYLLLLLSPGRGDTGRVLPGEDFNAYPDDSLAADHAVAFHKSQQFESNANRKSEEQEAKLGSNDEFKSALSELPHAPASNGRHPLYDLANKFFNETLGEPA